MASMRVWAVAVENNLSIKENAMLVKCLVRANSWYDSKKKENPDGLAFYIMIVLAALPIICIVNMDILPWWATALSVLVLLAGFLVRFMWVVIGADMIKYVEEKYDEETLEA